MTGTETPTVTERVIVGVDGSASAEQALDWVRSKSDLFHDVVPTLTYHVESVTDGVGLPYPYPDTTEMMEKAATSLLTQSIADRSDVADAASIMVGYAGPALVRAAQDADLLVVGNRGRSAITETLLGSVGSYCVKHSSCPVVVVTPDTALKPTIDRIVVGVDGSKNAQAALQWAARHTSVGGRITAIGCWTIPPYSEAFPFSSEQLESRIRDDLTASIAEAREATGRFDDLAIDANVEYGDPRTVLREAADAADLLVIGARGHKGVAHLVLGSVATSLLHHPTIATVVVPHDDAAE